MTASDRINQAVQDYATRTATPPPTGGSDHGHTLTVEQTRPARIVVVNRWLSTVALILGILVLVSVLYAEVAIGRAAGDIRDRLNQVDPTPAVTGCPFGPDLCGG